MRRHVLLLSLIGASLLCTPALAEEDAPAGAAAVETEARVPAAAPAAAGDKAPMTPQRLLALLKREKLSPEGEPPHVSFYVGRTRVYVNIDEEHDRVRFAIPLAKLDTVDAERHVELLKANYHATGDVRFAVNRNVVWLVYVHRLSTLVDADALSAINQLAHHAKGLVKP